MRNEMGSALPMVVCLSGLLVTGCAVSDSTFNAHGAVFYCDGAGGGITNWAQNVARLVNGAKL